MLWSSRGHLDKNGVNNIYLLDTNILIYYFNDDPAVQPIFEAIQVGDAVGFYCPISWVELLCYPDLTEAEANLMREFLRTLSSVSLMESVLDCAAEIRRNYRVKSTALYSQLVLYAKISPTLRFNYRWNRQSKS